MEFTEEAIYTLRRIEHLHTVQGLDLAWLKTMFDLLDEVERLRAELRFLPLRGEPTRGLYLWRNSIAPCLGDQRGSSASSSPVLVGETREPAEG
jgi:hypothetical protein